MRFLLFFLRFFLFYKILYFFLTYLFRFSLFSRDILILVFIFEIRFVFLRDTFMFFSTYCWFYKNSSIVSQILLFFLFLRSPCFLTRCLKVFPRYFHFYKQLKILLYFIRFCPFFTDSFICFWTSFVFIFEIPLLFMKLLLYFTRFHIFIIGIHFVLLRDLCVLFILSSFKILLYFVTLSPSFTDFLI